MEPNRARSVLSSEIGAIAVHPPPLSSASFIIDGGQRGILNRSSSSPYLNDLVEIRSCYAVPPSHPSTVASTGRPPPVMASAVTQSAMVSASSAREPTPLSPGLQLPSGFSSRAKQTPSEANEGPVLSFINKRLRALRKKQNRIAQIEEAIAQGKTLNKEQEGILKSKPSVFASIDSFCGFGSHPMAAAT